MLLAGTNDKNILTFDIKHLLEVEPFHFDASSMGASEHFEEDKELHIIREENDDMSQYKFRDRDDDEEEEKIPGDEKHKLDDTDFLNKQEIDDDEQLKTIL